MLILIILLCIITIKKNNNSVENFEYANYKTNPELNNLCNKEVNDCYNQLNGYDYESIDRPFIKCVARTQNKKGNG